MNEKGAINLKKLLSTLIAVCMLFATYVASFAEGNSIIGDKNEKYNLEAYEDALLVMEELLDTVVFGEDPEHILTRAEFVAGIVNIFDVQKINGETSFLDVEEDYKYAGEINAALSLGWISKNDNFNPDEKITLAQALKILLVATDYTMLAEAKGGYPNGYMKVAGDLDLFDNIKSVEASTLSVANASILYYNLMFAPVFEITAVGESVSFEISNKTQLERMYEAYPVKGVVTSTEHNSILAEAPFEKDNGKIEIDGIAYKYEDSDISLLGKNVVAYCSIKDSEPKQIYCIIPERNEEISFLANDFAQISGGYINYYQDNKLCKKRLDTAYKVIYNGRRVEKLEKYMVEDISSTVRLLSNNGDSSYEYIFVDSYEYGIISSVDYVEGYIAFKTPEHLIDVSEDEENACYFRDGNGKRIEIYELKKDMAAAIKISADRRIYEIVVLEDTVTGVVTSTYADEDKLDLDNKTYYISAEFKEKYIDTNIITTGDSINAVLGIRGEIAYLVANPSDSAYGVLNKVGKASKGINSKIEVEILTEDCEFKIFEISEKVTIDGQKPKMERETAYSYISDRLTETQEKVNKPVLLIKYSLDKDGKIKMIDFPSDDTSSFGKVLDSQNSLTQYLENETLQYRVGGFASKVMVKTSKILFVPKKLEERAEEENFDFGTYTKLSNNIGSYTIDAYDVDETGNAAFVVVYLADTENNKVAAYSDTYIIEKVRIGTFDDEDVYKLYCWSNNKYTTVYMPMDVNVVKTSGETTLVPGDIVRFTLQNNKVKKVFVDYDYSSGTHVPEPKGGGQFNIVNAQHYLSFLSGKVYNVSPGILVISDAADGEGNISFDFQNLRPYSLNNVIACFDSETKTVRTIKLENIHTYIGHGQGADTVFLRSDYDSPKCAIIVR